MKLYTNENNPATLKLFIASKYGQKNIDIHSTELSASTVNCPRTLPTLEVEEDVYMFSSNAAALYLYPLVGEKLTTECAQHMEWEATRLLPAIWTILTSKTVGADVKQVLSGHLEDLNKTLTRKQYILGNNVTAVDISVWSSLYLLYNNDNHKSYFNSTPALKKWFDGLAELEQFKNGVKDWNGSITGPFPQMSTLGLPSLTPAQNISASPEESNDEGPSQQEVEEAKVKWINCKKKTISPNNNDVPCKDRKNILITSALPYVNNIPHLGNIIGCVLSGDIFARYCRLCDYNTLYICGTDEYGTATETKALQEKCSPQEICDRFHAIHKSVYDWFNIEFDHFGRTSTPQQKEIVQELFLKLHNNGFMHSESVEQLLCQKCNRFLADRFVEGGCPHPGCGYEDARGDQCDKCGKLINAIDLIDPKCKVCSTKPVLKSSSQFFIDLPQLEPSLRAWVNRSEANWTPSARAVARSWLKEGLKSRCITRDLKWGVPVPVKGYEEKVFYVWFDAPLGYLSITKAYTEKYLEWWKPKTESKDTIKLYQFMAKDNVPFHAILFPAMIMGFNEGYKLVDHIFAIEYLNYEEGKFSKSRGVGVFGTDAKDTEIPVDVWRYYLSSIRPEGQDASFSWAELGTRNNSELLNNLGNFCHRSLSFVASSFKGIVPNVQPNQEDFEVIALVNREISAYVKDMERGRLRDSLKHVMIISRLGNQYMQSNQPWVLLKSADENEKIRGASAVGLCAELVALICTLISPYMPSTCDKLKKQLNLHQFSFDPEYPFMGIILGSGHKIGKPEPLFAKLEMDRLMELKKKYAGTQEERADRENSPPKTSVKEIEAAIAQQGEKVRQLKASTKDKGVWQPEVDTLLKLKKQLEIAQKTQNSIPVSSTKSVEDLEKAIAQQGEKVRQLKASTKDKGVWQPEVNVLLDLKKQLEAAQKSQTTSATNDSKKSAEQLEKAISEQGDKVRKLKASTKDKSVWQPEVDILLQLKKQLASIKI